MSRQHEVVGRDGVPGLEPRDAFQPCDVEQDAAAGNALGELVDRAVLGAVWADVAGREAVEELTVVEDVSQAVTLRGRLQRHEHVVVGKVERTGEVLVVTSLGHESDGVDPTAARLWTVPVEGNAQVEDCSSSYKSRRGHEAIRGDQVDGAPLVVVTPATPIAQAGPDLPEVVHVVVSFARRALHFESN